MEKYQILVSLEKLPDNDVRVTVAQISGEEKLKFSEIAYCLSSGISLAIKMVKSDGEDDHVVMGRIIEYLNKEFVSNESFSNARILTGFTNL